VTTREPQVGDYILRGSPAYGQPGMYRGTVVRVVRRTPTTAALDSGEVLKMSRRSWNAGNPWCVAYVESDEAERWRAAKVAHDAAVKAWREAMGAWMAACPKPGRCTVTDSRDMTVQVGASAWFTDAEAVEAFAAQLPALAAWLRAKPVEPAPTDDLLIRIAAPSGKE
jgi:DNA-directed RNA polymerase subunit H (RpoH/RPB5)